MEDKYVLSEAPTMTIDRRIMGSLTAVTIVGLVGGLVYAGHLGGGGAPEADPSCSGACTTCPVAARGECPSPGACEADTAHINQDKCVKCLRCVQVAPEAYELDAATGTVRIRPDAPAEDVERGAQACPVHAVQH